MAKSTFPTNSAILVFEQGSPEFKRAVVVDSLVASISDVLQDLRNVVKCDRLQSGAFDFSRMSEKYNISLDTIQCVVDEVRRGMYETLSNQGIDIDSIQFVIEVAMEEHLPECNFPHGPLGQPGCICVVTNRNYLKDLQSKAKAFDDIQASVESLKQALAKKHYNRWDALDATMRLVDIASVATTGTYVD